MAARGSSRSDGAKVKSDPVYTVVEISEEDGGTVLRIVHPGLSAKTQQAALDKIWAERPAGSKKVHLGAFLAGSWRSCEFDAKEVIVPEKKNHGPEALEGALAQESLPVAEGSGSPVS